MNDKWLIWGPIDLTHYDTWWQLKICNSFHQLFSPTEPPRSSSTRPDAPEKKKVESPRCFLLFFPFLKLKKKWDPKRLTLILDLEQPFGSLLDFCFLPTKQKKPKSNEPLQHKLPKLLSPRLLNLRGREPPIRGRRIGGLEFSHVQRIAGKAFWGAGILGFDFLDRFDIRDHDQQWWMRGV